MILVRRNDYRIARNVFANPEVGLDINISGIKETDIPSILFSEKPGFGAGERSEICY